MCYMVYFSTNSPEDLTVKAPTYTVYRAEEDVDSAVHGLLSFKNKWYLESKWGGCSCYFRHMEDGYDPVSGQQNPGSTYFSEPQDWYPEDPEDVESTGDVYDLFLRLIREGYSLDVIDTWNDEVHRITEKTVSLSEVSRAQFRFFLNYKFNVIK